MCFKSSFACDGDANCVDKSDEKNCICLAEQFKCETSGRCISVRKRCDGLNDCGDGSDENRCCKSSNIYDLKAHLIMLLKLIL